jgi:hypothetical protein
MMQENLIKKLIWVLIFSISMAFIESAVVVYLRKIYYPDGFAFPLILSADKLIIVEVLREIATMFMLISVSVIAGRKIWERFAYFMLCFGIWDIFYYIWLKFLLDWPPTIFEWDILFLIPLPWIGPVIAPVTLSVLMIVFGFIIIYLYDNGNEFKPVLSTKYLVIIGTGLILFSFMRDINAALNQQLPQPYMYELLIIGELLYIMAFAFSLLKTRKAGQTLH